MTPYRPRSRSFTGAVACALRGVGRAARTQPYFRVHLVIAAGILLAAIGVGLSGVELAVVAVVIGLVLAAEVVNTALEMLTDLVHPDEGPAAAAVKDVSAAAVLTAVLIALAVGAFVFLPRLPPLAPVVTRGLPVALAVVCLAVALAGAVRRGPSAGA